MQTFHEVHSVVVTSDHNMTGSESGENRSESTLKKEPVRIAILIQAEEGREEVQKTKCVVYVVCCIGVLQRL